ncbi:MAG: MFS transporter [Woeseiaceae bacterium]|nr:MFS transporter [Woeseiaceae bacterium]
MPESSQFSLLGQRRFLPYFATQFLGALNDNIFRNGLIILVAFQGIVLLEMQPAQLTNVAAALFILPYFVFSATAGQLADKYEKSLLFRRIKLFEIVLMLIATAALVTESYILLLLVLFMMGFQSTLFGPVKFAYLPQNLSNRELVGGNALVEAGTYIAIIIGLIVGGVAVALDPDRQYLLSGCLIVVALFGYLASRSIPTTPAVDPGLKINWNVARETIRIIGFARQERSVFLSIMGISWFWFFGTVMTVQLPGYTKEVLFGTEIITTCLLVAFAVGVGIGSLLCERLSRHRIELGLVPFGSIGLSLFAVDLFFAQPLPAATTVASVGEFLARPGSLRVLFDLMMIGAFGGVFSVPLYALIQHRTERKHLSRVIAANNIINSIFMVIASLLAIVLLGAGLSIPQLFVVLAVLNGVVAIYIYSLLPEFLLRFLAWIIITVFYRVRLSGVDRVPEHGPAIVVCNHVSYMDPILLAGCLKRPMRFVTYYKVFETPVLNAIFRHAKAIPIASASEDEAMMEAAFEAIDAELADGNVVCIFPEGGITYDGEIQRFRPGIERVLERRPVPVVPVSLGRLWGSWFSRRRDGGLRKIPGRLFARVPVSVGMPVAGRRATAAGLELLVRTLRGDER